MRAARRSIGSTAIVAAIACALSTRDVAAAPGLDDYRRFRALTIDLLGRVPSRSEVAAFERGLDVDAWIERELHRGAHVERLARTYLDLLRLTAAPSFRWSPDASILRRVKVKGPDGREVYVYFRRGQRRLRPETDGEFCLTERETGLKVKMANELVPAGSAVSVDAKVFESATRLVRPWWLYADEKSASPKALFGVTWHPGGGYKPIDDLLFEPDGSRTVAVRVCREEAQESETGTVLATGRENPPSWAKEHQGEAVSCRTAAGATLSADCGCGAGLWACLPGDANRKDPFGFELPSSAPLGLDAPFERGPAPYSQWHKFWWSAEAETMLRRVFGDDTDLRELVRGRGTWVNGPLAQLYRATAPTMAGGYAKGFAGMGATEPLVDPERLAGVTLSPHDFDTWVRVEDRGKWAAGIGTTPAFLTKYASRRARAAALYTAFLCRSFVAGDARLTPSSEPDLRRRAGCASCHGALEPMAAYFTRVVETDFLLLPPRVYPVDHAMCRPGADGLIKRVCAMHYDPAFASGEHAYLRGAYASIEHAETGPSGLGQEIAESPDFADCAASRMASAFLGRPLGPDDAELEKRLVKVLRESGYRARPVVAAILRSTEYEKSSVWSSGEERARGVESGAASTERGVESGAASTGRGVESGATAAPGGAE